MSDNIESLYRKMQQVHEKVDAIFKAAKVPSMLMNEYNNKVSQYENMYETVETMKAMAGKEEAVEKLIFQQKEILNVRIKCELELAGKAKEYL